MPSRLCPRCHNDLPTEDTGELTYCPHCGAAQIVLSEELRDQFEQQQLAAQQAADGIAPAEPIEIPEAPAADPTAVVWPRVLQLIALAAIAFAAAMVLTLALPPLVLLLLLWMLGAPIILLGIYAAKNPQTRITTAFGARIGLLSGLSVGSAFVTVDVLAMFVQRFLLHKSADLDAQFAASIEQTKAMFAQISANDPGAFQHYLDMLKIPEFHAGMALAGCAIIIAVYSIYSTAAGAFSGALRSRSATK